MKLIKCYGTLTATIVNDTDGVNIYVTNNITDSLHLFTRLGYHEPLTNMYIALEKIKSSAEELNQNFKKY